MIIKQECLLQAGREWRRSGNGKTDLRQSDGNNSSRGEGKGREGKGREGKGREEKRGGDNE